MTKKRKAAQMIAAKYARRDARVASRRIDRPNRFPRANALRNIKVRRVF